MLGPAAVRLRRGPVHSAYANAPPAARCQPSAPAPAPGAPMTLLKEGRIILAAISVPALVVDAGAVGSRHMSVFHRFFSRAQWALDDLDRVVFRLALPWLPAEAPPIVIVVPVEQGPEFFQLHRGPSRHRVVTSIDCRISAGPRLGGCFGRVHGQMGPLDGRFTQTTAAEASASHTGRSTGPTRGGARPASAQAPLQPT